MPSFQPSRRQVAVGMAWSVPAVALSQQLPAFAVSASDAPLKAKVVLGAYPHEYADGSDSVVVPISFGRVTVENLPAGVRVKNVFVAHYFGNDTLRWLNNENWDDPRYNGAQYLKDRQYRTDGSTTDSWAAETTGAKWIDYYDTKTSTQDSPVRKELFYWNGQFTGGKTHTGPSGSDKPMEYFSMSMEQLNQNVDNPVGATYTKQDNGLETYVLWEMGEILVRQRRQSEDSFVNGESDAKWRSFAAFRIELTDGRHLSWQTWDDRRAGDFYGTSPRVWSPEVQDDKDIYFTGDPNAGIMGILG